MNQRIKELAKEAERQYGGMYVVDIEKFAELIVQECLLKINGAKIRNESYTELIERIKEDFGI
jgi:HEPN domain-containing protein